MFLLEYLLFDRNRKYSINSLIQIFLYYILMVICTIMLTRFNVAVPLKVSISLGLICLIGSNVNKRTIKNGALLGTTFLTATMICDLLSAGILNFITDFSKDLSAPTLYNAMAMAISKIILAIFILVLSKFINKTVHNIVYGNWLIIILPNLLNLFFTIMIGNRIYYTKYSERVETALLIFIILMILISTLCFIVISEYYAQMKEMEHKNKINMDQIKLQYEYFCNKQEDDLKLREIYHDMKNHLLVLQDELENEQKQQYIKSLLKEVKSYESYIDTGNDFLNSIINEKYKEAASKGIEFDVQIDFSNISFIAPIDICTIFSNAIDNAIEACEKITNQGQKGMSIKARKIRNFLTIAFENTNGEKLLIENEEIVTTKKDKQNHGFGLNNIKRAVEKYEGECKIKIDVEHFILYLVIPCTA